MANQAIEEDEEEEYGTHFGKPDLYRLGFFDDGPFGPWDEYHDPKSQLRTNLRKGKQILCKHEGGLFERQFKRILTGEVLPGDGRPQKRTKPPKQPKIRPVGGSKKHSTPGDWYGCIGRQPKRFDPATNPVEPSDPEPPNFAIKPNPFGGPGYVNICLNPYVPIYKGREPYDPDYEKPNVGDDPGKAPRRYVTTCRPQQYFNENPYNSIEIPVKPDISRKRQVPKTKAVQHFHLTFPRAPQGENSGCFTRFPKHYPDPYQPQPKKAKRKVPKAILKPVGGPPQRSKFTVSIIDKVTGIACNPLNYTDYREQVYPLR